MLVTMVILVMVMRMGRFPGMKYGHALDKLLYLFFRQYRAIVKFE